MSYCTTGCVSVPKGMTSECKVCNDVDISAFALWGKPAWKPEMREYKLTVTIAARGFFMTAQKYTVTAYTTDVNSEGVRGWGHGTCLECIKSVHALLPSNKRYLLS